MRSYAASEDRDLRQGARAERAPVHLHRLQGERDLSLIGAIVAEYFSVGRESVLGQFIITEAAFFDLRTPGRRSWSRRL